LVVFLSVTAIGLSGRLLVENLRLTRRLRLSLVLVAIAMAMVVCLSFLHSLGVEGSGRGAILPIVALAFMVERFHMRAEEKGHRDAIFRLGETVLVAGVTLAVFRIRPLQEILLAHPEGLLIVAGLLILEGRHEVEKAGLHHGTGTLGVPDDAETDVQD
jgi:hypothetical protein